MERELLPLTASPLSLAHFLYSTITNTFKRNVQCSTPLSLVRDYKLFVRDYELLVMIVEEVPTRTREHNTTAWPET